MTLLIAYLFYLGFALSISIYRLWLKDRLNNLNKFAFGPILIGFWVLDVFINWTALIVLMGFPPAGTHTISDRFEVYHHGDYGWKSSVAKFVCEELLNPVDPNPEGHC